ncbi:DUF4157 domain-containing protein [Paradesertivirga mongoliensis]|uniref:DUF4157 domain-containing protein n=1 Tax=Paradesertivirga mongoliensis TaxID=2100740 RepID=A0ABW4ZML7_9SPHI|nr:DUF4157 domain-containing protein [Pedobacter mongoliensis]
MFSSAEKTTKSSAIARKQSGQDVSFFRKADEQSFFGAQKTDSFFGSPVQPKLSVSQPDDPYEKEADQVAETVMRMPEPASETVNATSEEKLQLKEEEEEQEDIQPKLQAPSISTVQCKEDEENLQAKLFDSIHRKSSNSNYTSATVVAENTAGNDTISRKSDSFYHSNVIQRSGRGPPQPSATFEETLSNSNGAGSALPQETRGFMGSRFNANFDNVRIHTGSTAEKLSSSINAQAFTHGNNIYFNSGKYSPNTASGGLLLAHELTHTIQQGAAKANQTSQVARKPLIQRSAGASVPQLDNAVAKAKGEEGKVNANKEGPDGYREGWPRLLEYFKTTFGEDMIISGGGGTTVTGAVSEMDIKKKREASGMRPNQGTPSTNDRVMRDAMPSWCGIFVFWALNKGGVPMKKWELGGRMVTPESARIPGETPQVGDIAYRNEFSHFAIVEKVSGSTVTTVNGNTSGEDNLGAQVQSRDHPLSNWTAFFDPIKLKTGALQNGEAQAVEEKPKTLRELRKELFNVSRKEETGGTNEEEVQTNGEQSTVQTKPELSNWVVNAKGDLNSTQNKANEEQVQLKEEENQELESAGGLTEHSLQRKTSSLHDRPLQRADNGIGALSNGESSASPMSANSLVHRSVAESEEEVSESNRGPPVVQRTTSESVQPSWFDDAFEAVGSFVADTLEAGKRLFLNEARDFVMAIPGYRALRVVLGEDPITGEEVEPNGHNFIEAAFDIMPGGRLLHQKLNELGALNDAALWVDRQIATVAGLVHGVISRVSQFIESLNMERLASPRALFEEAGNIIHSTIQRIVDFAITAATELLETVKRFLLTQIVDFVKNHTTAYPLLTVILGQDPITDESVDRNGANILNALLELGGEEGIAQRTQMQETGTFQKVADWIDRGIGVFSDAYDQIKAAFNVIWGRVSIESLMHPIDTFNLIYEQFAAPVQRVWNFVEETAIIILRFIKEVLMLRLSAWARTVRGYALVTVIIEKDPFTEEVVPRTMENLIKGFMSLMEGGEEQFNQLKESGAIERTTARIEAAVARLNMTPAYIVQLFTDLWNSFSLSDLAQPIQAFERILAQFGEPIGRLIAFVVEIIRIVIEVILQVMNFPTALIGNIITKAMLAFELIKADPVGFLKNLLRAIKQGFIQFFDNILQHLMTGITGWLLSELRDAGVTAPTDFSLRGIIGWVLEVLGISMERIWEKLAAHPRIGPARVARIRSMISTLEGIWTFIKDVQERGIAAIWDKIQEQLTNLWDTVLDAIKNWIMEQIVNRMVTRLLSMLDPTGIMAVVNSAIALYSAIQSFIRYLREMLEIVNSFVEGVVEIASGNVTRAANFLEGALARSMPVIIGFLANQVGLSGIGRRIGEMIETARELVDEALTWLVNRAVDTGFAIFDRLMSMGRAAVGTVLGWLGIRKEFTATNGESHELYFEGNDEATAEMWVASRNPMRYSEFLSNVQTANNPAKAAKKQEALTKLQEVQQAKRQPLQPGVPEEQARSTKSDAVNGKVIELSVPTAHLFGGPIRPLEINFGGADSAGFATSMSIKNLNKNNRPPTGGPPRVTNAFYRKLDQRRNGATTYYIKGHLLNGYLGGSGSDFRNLTPLSREGNGYHERQVEALVIAQVDAGKTVEYFVTPTPGAPRTISDAQLQSSNVPQTRWAAVRDIISAEAFVPSGLTCVANVLNDATGLADQSIVNTTVPNPIDLNLSNYET